MALSTSVRVSTDRQGRELLRHGTPLFPLACYDDNISELEVAWHWHDELEALTVEAGTARIAVGAADHIVHRGEGFFINAGVLHGVWPVGEAVCRLHSVIFHPRLVGGSVDSMIWQKYLEPLRTDPGRPCVHFADHREWERYAMQAIQKAWRVCVSETDGFEIAAREQLTRLIFLLTKNHPATEKSPSEKALRDGARVKVMLQYIQAHCAEKLTLTEIAQSAAISGSECLRCFRSIIRSTPIQYVKQVRVQRAAELLLSTDRKISDIAAECGFQEMSYFAKTFRELKGCTPGAFRARSRQAPDSQSECRKTPSEVFGGKG